MSFSFNEIGERLRLDLEVESGHCAICKSEPPSERLELVLEMHGDRYEVTICRFCLAEYAPQLLAEIEAE